MFGGVGHERGVVGGAEELVVGGEGALLGFESDGHAVDFIICEFLPWDGAGVLGVGLLDFCFVKGAYFFFD